MRRTPAAVQWVFLPVALIALMVVQAAGRNVMQQASTQPGSVNVQATPPQRTPMQQRAVEIIAAEDAANPPAPLSAAECAEFRTQNPGSESIPCNQGDPVPATSDDWDKAALAFEQTHPDLKLGSNTAVMQDMLERLARPNSAAEPLLNQAYAAARNDPRWMGVQSATPSTGIIWDDLRTTSSSEEPHTNQPRK